MYIARTKGRKQRANMRMAAEAQFQARLAEQKEMYEAQIAKLVAELASVRTELTKMRTAHDELKARPAKFVLVAAPLGGEGSSSQSAEGVANQLKQMLDKSGIKGQSLVFEGA